MECYERLRLLGKGTYGKAWLVQERASKAPFVMKEIRVQNQKEMDEALAEAEVLSRVDHVNIIKFAHHRSAARAERRQVQQADPRVAQGGVHCDGVRRRRGPC